MKVLLESTSQTMELIAGDAQVKTDKGVPARIWQGHVVDVDHGEMRKELFDVADRLTRERNNLHPDTIEAHRDALRYAIDTLVNVATLLDETRGGIAVHALITRIAHKLDEPQGVVDRFTRELQQHAAPRPEYERAYSLRMFI